MGEFLSRFIELMRAVAQAFRSVKTCSARVVTKRLHIFGESAMMTYFVTFEMDNDTHREIEVSGKDFAQLVQGDVGTLEFQGTHFRSFKLESVVAKKAKALNKSN